MTNHPVLLPQIPETAALGAALLAGIGCRVYGSVTDALNSIRYTSIEVLPDTGRAAWYNEIFNTAYLPLYGAVRELNHTLAGIQSKTVAGVSPSRSGGE